MPRKKKKREVKKSKDKRNSSKELITIIERKLKEDRKAKRIESENLIDSISDFLQQVGFSIFQLLFIICAIFGFLAGTLALALVFRIYGYSFIGIFALFNGLLLATKVGLVFLIVSLVLKLFSWINKKIREEEEKKNG